MAWVPISKQTRKFQENSMACAMLMRNLLWSNPWIPVGVEIFLLSMFDWWGPYQLTSRQAYISCRHQDGCSLELVDPFQCSDGKEHSRVHDVQPISVNRVSHVGAQPMTYTIRYGCDAKTCETEDTYSTQHAEIYATRRRQLGRKDTLLQRRDDRRARDFDVPSSVSSHRGHGRLEHAFRHRDSDRRHDRDVADGDHVEYESPHGGGFQNKGIPYDVKPSELHFLGHRQQSRHLG